MSKVIMFSKEFPKYHPRAGQSTEFAEKLITGFLLLKKVDLEVFEQYDLLDVWGRIKYLPKFHTIRAGHSRKVGDYFSPRQWQTKPYRSNQITLWKDVEIVKTWDFNVVGKGIFQINGNFFDITDSDIPMNDGLNNNDFREWFAKDYHFEGQIICWNKKIDYSDLYTGELARASQLKK